MSTDAEISNLEWRLCEVAIRYRRISKWAENAPLHAIIDRGLEAYNVKKEFDSRVDDLIAAYEKAEKKGPTPIGLSN